MKRKLKFVLPTITLLLLLLACNKESNEDFKNNSEKIIGTWIIEKTETYVMKDGKFERTKTIDHKPNNYRINFISDGIAVYKGNYLNNIIPEHLSGTWLLEKEEDLNVKGLEPKIIISSGVDISEPFYTFPPKSKIINIDDTKLVLKSPNLLQPKSHLKTYLSK